MKKCTCVILTILMLIYCAAPVSAANECSDTQTISIKGKTLTSEERNALVRKEVEKLLGADTLYRLYFSDDEATAEPYDENIVSPCNDIDEYKTEYSNTVRKSISGAPSGSTISFSVSGDANYIAFYYVADGGPSVSASVSFSTPYPVANFSVSLGVVNKTNSADAVIVGVKNAVSGYKYYMESITKTYDVQSYIIYKKQYDDAGSYTWAEWSSGCIKTLCNIDYHITHR